MNAVAILLAAVLPLAEGPPLASSPRKVRGHAFAKRRVAERLDRALTATAAEGGGTYVSWRMLPSDPKATTFHLYRRAGDGKSVRVTDQPVCKVTGVAVPGAPDAARYHSRAMVGGREGADSRPATALPAGYLRLKLKGDYTFQKVGIADLDGDGRYDYVIKQPHDNIDPWFKYWKRSPETYKLEAYRHDGEFLWRYDLGWAIERGIWYSPYVVADLDGDGKAEVAVKTGEGDPRDEEGKVRSGPEHVTILDGLTGKPRTRADWPSRKHFTGEHGYNYASRNQLGVAYLDGRTQCLIVERGTYNVTIVDAYEFSGGQLKKLWRWTNRSEPKTYWGQGAHWMHAGDIDGDGRDEVLIGSAVIDDDGRALWSTGLGHPDHFYLGDLDPRRAGLEIYYGIEPRRPDNAMCMIDAKTGRILWGHDEPTKHIHSSGLASDIDPKHPGAECYSGERDLKDKRWLRTARGEVLDVGCERMGGLSPRAAYWDADPQRELLINGRIWKYAQLGKKPIRENITGRVVAVADVLGDWREEIITSVPGEMRVYTTGNPAADRRPCLMTDPVYRADVTHAAMGYYQVPMLSYDVETEGGK